MATFATRFLADRLMTTRGMRGAFPGAPELPLRCPCLAVDFVAVDFLTVDFLVVDFFAVACFAVAFLAGDFFAVAFLAGDVRAVVLFARVLFVAAATLLTARRASFVTDVSLVVDVFVARAGVDLRESVAIRPPMRRHIVHLHGLSHKA